MDADRVICTLLTFALFIAAVAGLYNITHPIEVEAIQELTSEPIQTADVAPETEVEPIETVNEFAELPTHPSAPVYDDDELIAMVVHAEAKGEIFVGKIAVASVVLNRCDAWGMTVESVVYQPNQLTIEYTYTDDDMKAVQIAKDCRELFPANLLYFRNEHYHTFGIPYAVIGHHYFSLEEEK